MKGKQPMITEQYSRYPQVDSAVGSRILLAFRVAQRALEQRLRPPWQLAPLRAFTALGLDGPHQPNLALVFHDLVLDQGAHGQALAVTGGAIPGRYRDALPARVRHDPHIVGDGAAATITESYQVDVAAGGTIELQLSYQRGPRLRLAADRP